MTQSRDFLTHLVAHDAVLVTVHRHRGSVPRELGAWMAVFADCIVGTVGGGHLEWQAIGEARARLQGIAGSAVLRYALGPRLGQCCGGEVHLRFEAVTAGQLSALQQHFDAVQRQWPQLAVFGGGHVGGALVRLLARLPLQVRWIDSRDEVFPPTSPDNVACEHSDPVQAAVATLAAGSLVLIMSFSHAQDLDVVAACLLRQRTQADLGLIGLIGSQTRWATFRHRLEARGFGAHELARVTCPIGVPGIDGKEPEVIAVAVAAQVLQAVQTAAHGRSEMTKDL